MLKKSFIILLVSNMFFSSGCLFLAAGAAGVGTVTWLSDKASQLVDQPSRRVARSTKEVFDHQQIDLTKQTNTPEVIQILGKYHDGRQVWVDVRPRGGAKTLLEVRVGWVNGKNDAMSLSKQIADKANSVF